MRERYSLPVERAILNRFGQMGAANFFISGEIGDGPGDFENAGVRTCAQAQSRHRVFQQFLSGRVELAEFANIAAAHLRITKNCPPREPLELPFPCTIRARADRGRVFPRSVLT